MKASLKERIVHALGFEFLAVLFCAPVLSLAFNKPVINTGTLTLALSALAMLWNMTYNYLIDCWIRTKRLNWSIGFRIVHGLGLEVGIIAICVPMAALILEVTFWQALAIEAGFFAFILPYTVFYNWMFDIIKSSHITNRSVTKD